MILIAVSPAFVFVARMAELQEIYYYATDTIDRSEGVGTENINFYPLLDGYFKEMRMAIMCQTASDGVAPVMVWQITQQTEVYAEVGGVDNVLLNIMDTGDFGLDEAFAFTSSYDDMIHFTPLSKTTYSMSYLRERVSRTVKANTSVTSNYGVIFLTESSGTGGSWQIYFEVMQVVNATVFRFLFARPSGMKFILFVSEIAETAESFSIEFPCAGYLTNMSVLTTGTDVNDHPVMVTLTTQDIDLKDEWAFSNQVWYDRGKNQNGVVIQPIYSENISATNYSFYFEHFGKSYIRITDRATLNYYFTASTATNFTMMFTGDFVPFKNAIWKQVYVNSDFAATESYGHGFSFPIDINNCSVTLVTTVLTGDGTMSIKLWNPQGKVNPTLVVADSDISTITEFESDGLYNKQSLQAIIPFSHERGAQSPTVRCGNVKAGTLFVWDFIGTPDMTGTMHMIITGRVGKQSYSRDNKFVYSPNTLNFTEIPASMRFG